MNQRSTYIFDYSNLNASNVLALINSEPILAYDTETTGLNVRKEKIIGFSVAGAKFAFYIIMKVWQGGQLVEQISYDQVKPLIAALTGKKLLTFNGSFDSRITKNQIGIDLAPNIYADVMLLAHTLDENKFQYGLKPLAAEVFGAQVLQERSDMMESIAENGGTKHEMYKANSQLMAKYGAQDAALTYDLWQHYDKQLTSKLRKFFYEDEIIPLYRHVTIPMESKGIPVDVPLLQQSLLEINADLEACEIAIQTAIAPLLPAFNEWFVNKEYAFKLTGRFKEFLGRKIAPKGWPLTPAGTVSLAVDAIAKAKKKGLLQEGSEFEAIISGKAFVPKELVTSIQMKMAQEDGLIYAFNLSSKDHLKRLFFGTSTTKSPLSEKPLSRTDKGSPQIDDEFLALMAKKYEWCNELQVYNKLIKLRGTYIEQYLEKQEDGIFYPSFHQHRTVSGRYSGDTQQLPRPIKTGDKRVVKYTNLVKQFFSCKEGETFLDFDYDSQEVKVFAHVSGDEGLKNIFARGEDFYSTVAINAEKLQGYSADKNAENYLGTVNKYARQKAKAYALGLAFGMSPYKLKFELNCSESEAKQIYDGYMRSYPRLKQWMDRTKVLVCSQGWIETEAGRVRRYPELKQAYAQYGEVLFDGLQLWQRYNDEPKTYDRMKELSGRCKNALNNAYNIQIQGLASSMTNRAAIQCSKMLIIAGLKGYIAGVTHDEIIIRCPLTEVKEAANILTEAMETAYPISVKMTAPKSHGPNLAVSKG